MLMRGRRLLKTAAIEERECFDQIPYYLKTKKRWVESWEAVCILETSVEVVTETVDVIKEDILT